MTATDTVTLTRDRIDYAAQIDPFIDSFRRDQLKKVKEKCDDFETYTYLLLQHGWKAPADTQKKEPEEEK